MSEGPMMDHAHAVRLLEARAHLAERLHADRGDLSDEQFAGVLDRMAEVEVSQHAAPSITETRRAVAARLQGVQGDLPDERFARLIDRIAEHQVVDERATKRR